MNLDLFPELPPDLLSAFDQHYAWVRDYLDERLPEGGDPLIHRAILVGVSLGAHMVARAYADTGNDLMEMGARIAAVLKFGLDQDVG